LFGFCLYLQKNSDMSKIKIQITGVSAELVLGNYMPADTTIFNDWQEFYRYNDIIHESQLLGDQVSEMDIRVDDEVAFKGLIPDTKFKKQKSFTPVMFPLALYLRTECAEMSVYQCEFETDNFDKEKLFLETQDYDRIFKVGNSFITNLLYDNVPFPLEYISGKRIGEICVLCRYNTGYLVPVYDAIKKLGSK